jgi:AraC family transcriptional regulator, transcriptional activator of the genes for pyochelin and ferripyochelin receptors
MLKTKKVPAGAGNDPVPQPPDNTPLLSERETRKMQDVEEFITNNFKSITSLADLARGTGVNKFKLKHTFKVLYGITAFEYAWGLRMEHAKILLAEPLLTIKEIAHIAGYRSQPNFTAGFKKWFGQPPSAFQKEMARKKSNKPFQG